MSANTKLLVIRIEDNLFNTKAWDAAHINEHRQLLNLWIDKGYQICLVSTMNIKKLQDIQKNLYIADNGYLIGCDGGQIYSIESNKAILDECFSTKELPLLERLVQRVDFDNLNSGLISFTKTNNTKVYLDNNSELFKKFKETFSANGTFNEIKAFPTDDDITKVTIKFASKIKTAETLALLNRLAPDFNYISNEDNRIDILPKESTLENAFDYICSKDKAFKGIVANKEIITIGFTRSDIYLFNQSKLSYTLISCPYEIASKATSTYMGEVRNIIAYTVKEILKTE